MLHDSPLRQLHEKHTRAQTPSVVGEDAQSQAQRPGAAVGQRVSGEVELIPYGPSDPAGGPACEIVANFGEVELEYAAIRRGAGLMDCSHRGTLQVTGAAADRRDFLNRMLTQELKDLAPGVARPAFWLNRKGRIDADLVVIELGDRALIDVDIHQAASAVKSLSEFLFGEDVKIEDVSGAHHHVCVHGKLAHRALAEAGGVAEFVLPPHSAASIVIAGVRVTAFRQDQTGEPGYHLIMAREQAAAVWESLLATDSVLSQNKRRVRPVGWQAFNIARIEAGTPLFNIDFGPTNLPHETGVLDDRVSFTKGCYLGQEIVARLQNLGKPKQRLVGLRVLQDLLPVAGAQVFARDEDGSMEQEIGVITSSTLSPMLGKAPIAFTMLKTAHSAAGESVIVNAEGEQAQAVTAPLQFWKPGEQADSAL